MAITSVITTYRCTWLNLLNALLILIRETAVEGLLKSSLIVIAPHYRFVVTRSPTGIALTAIEPRIVAAGIRTRVTRT